MSYVLIVEDDKAMAESLALMVQALGWDFQFAHSVIGAVRLAHIDPPTLILLDLHMPNMDGMDVLTYVKHDAATQNSAVVIVTVDDNPQTMQRAREGGAMDYLIKPVSLGQIESILSQLQR
jgi:DNA-binding response OmpR family regulator